MYHQLKATNTNFSIIAGNHDFECKCDIAKLVGAMAGVTGPVNLLNKLLHNIFIDEGITAEAAYVK